MGHPVSRKRPWLAALLAALATGLGHIYLRRWRRAFGWLAILFVSTALFVDPASLSPTGGLRSADLGSIAPTLIIGGFSVIDAYVLARAHNAEIQETPSEVRNGETAPEREISCPNCGKPLDRELEFCHWCTTRIGDTESTAPSEPNV